VDAVRDDLETLVLDADLLEAVLGGPDPGKNAKEIKISRWLRKRGNDLRFKQLGERLEALKARHEQGLLTSVEALKELLKLGATLSRLSGSPRQPIARPKARPSSRNCLRSEEQGHADHGRSRRQRHRRDRARRPLHGWQATHAVEREVKLALRKTLFKYRLR
jgi:type I restriction enzyme, R subunit